MGFKNERIHLTKNAVDHELIGSIKCKDLRFEACFCGILSKTKGVYDLIEIWQEILKSRPDSKLVIIGEGPEQGKIWSIIKAKSLEKNILLTGFLDEEQKISTMKSSKLFLFPSYQEGWGIVVMEAMACGVPVVSYDLSAYEAFAAGIVKVPIGEKKQMAGSILNLLADEGVRKALARDAEEASTLLNWNDISREEYKKIRELIS